MVQAHNIHTQTPRQAPPIMRRSGLAIGQLDGLWWLLHTRARNEKALAWDLNDRGIDYFLPLVRSSRRYGRRRVDVVLPLFSGYVFVSCTSSDDRYRVLATNRVASMIEVEDQTRLKAELERVRRAVSSPHKVSLYPGIKQGRRCRVTDGTLKGLEGVVVRRTGTGRVFLDVTMLGQSAVVEIDVTVLELTD